VIDDGEPAAPRYVVFNADDFGASSGVNRGIVEGHRNGVVTSASLMVTGRAADEGRRLAGEHPELAVGLHFDVWGEDERAFDLGDERGVRREFRRQLDAFGDLMGASPTHVDSHKHAHLDPRAFEIVTHEVAELGIPVRGDGRVCFVGGFYAQWEWGQTDLEHVSFGALEGILRDETPEPWTEVSCHPGYVSADFTSVYLAEREAELATLCDPAVRVLLGELGLTLASFADVPARSDGA
jgi:chitin disaccharide deacetylase